MPFNIRNIFNQQGAQGAVRQRREENMIAISVPPLLNNRDLRARGRQNTHPMTPPGSYQLSPEFRARRIQVREEVRGEINQLLSDINRVLQNCTTVKVDDDMRTRRESIRNAVEDNLVNPKDLAGMINRLVNMLNVNVSNYCTMAIWEDPRNTGNVSEVTGHASSLFQEAANELQRQLSELVQDDNQAMLQELMGDDPEYITRLIAATSTAADNLIIFPTVAVSLPLRPGEDDPRRHHIHSNDNVNHALFNQDVTNAMNNVGTNIRDQLLPRFVEKFTR